MTVETAMYQRLAADATVSANCGARIYTDQAPQSPTLPYITYIVVDTEQISEYTAPSGLSRPRVQIDVWASSPTERGVIGEAIRISLQAFRGAFGTESLDVRAIALEGPSHTFEPPQDAGEIGIYRARIDAVITHASATS